MFKLDHKSLKYVFLGYSRVQKGYRVTALVFVGIVVTGARRKLFYLRRTLCYTFLLNIIKILCLFSIYMLIFRNFFLQYLASFFGFFRLLFLYKGLGMILFFCKLLGMFSRPFFFFFFSYHSGLFAVPKPSSLESPTACFVIRSNQP